MTPGPQDVPGPDFDEPSSEPASALDTTVNAADETQVRAATKRQAQTKRTAAEFWQGIFARPEGRAEMYAILATGGLFETRGGVSGNGGYDPALTAYHQGMKMHAQDMFLAWLGYDRDGVMLMLAENNSVVQDAAKSASTPRPRRKPRQK